MAPTATPLPPVAVLSYYPANGLTDQTRQLSLAIALAELLGRRLVLPPVLHHEDALSTNAARLVPELIATRPRMRSLIEINTSSGLLDAADMPTVASLPRCAVANGTIDRVAARPLICEEDRSCTSCVHWVEPPDICYTKRRATRRPLRWGAGALLNRRICGNPSVARSMHCIALRAALSRGRARRRTFPAVARPTRARPLTLPRTCAAQEALEARRSALEIGRRGWSNRHESEAVASRSLSRLTTCALCCHAHRRRSRRSM